MSFHKLFLNIYLLSACTYTASLTQAANNEAIQGITRHPDSYQNMDDDAGELKKDIFLSDHLLPNIISYSDPVGYFNVGEVCMDWQSICHDSQFKKYYLNNSFNKLKSKVSAPDTLSGKFAKLFIEIEVAKIIEYHRPRFPYADVNQISNISSIRHNAMMNSMQRNLQRQAQRRQVPAQAAAQVLPWNNGTPLALNLQNALLLNLHANQLNQAAEVNQGVAANQPQVNPPESYLRNIENSLQRTLDRLNPRGNLLEVLGAALAVVDNDDNDDAMDLGLGFIAVPNLNNPNNVNERNLLAAKEEFESHCDESIRQKLRELSNNNFELLNTNPTLHSILLQELAAEIRNSSQFRTYVEQKASSYRTNYRTIDEINPAPTIETLSSTQLPENEREDNYLIMLKQVFDKTLTGE